MLPILKACLPPPQASHDCNSTCLFYFSIGPDTLDTHRDMAGAFPRDQTCHLIAQCSLGKADSTASLSQLEQDFLSQDIESWHQAAKNSSQVIGKVHFAEEELNQSTTGDGRDLASFSDALQAVTSSLKRVADIQVQLQDEALNWKQRYELERLKNLQLQRHIEASYPAEGKHGQPAQWNGQFSDGNGISAGRQIFRSTSVPPRALTSEYGSLKLKDGIGKASFRLGWGFDREKHRQHQHEIVSYECGNITAATRTSKQITLIWDTHPQSVCILCKPDSAPVQVLCKEMVRWLFLEKDMIVYVEPRVKNELVNADIEFSFVKTWENDDEVFLLHNKVDLLITLGGDGTVLWAASLFKGPVPPMVSFAMGSLGFMTPFHSQTYRESLEAVMEGPVYITLRHRLHCEVLRSQSNVKAGENTDSPPTEAYVVLNEVSIDRGMSSFLTNLECFCDNVFVTYVQGDGLILSTPSGSTAYSLAAGGSMVHPQVPAILFTPICPHSLSFRPLILPEYVTVRVQLPLHSRGNAWVSFDGKHRLQLNPGDALVCHMAACPVPAVCTEDTTYHFLRSVQEGLHWNLRKHQGTE